MGGPNHEQETEDNMSIVHSTLGKRDMDYYQEKGQKQTRSGIETPRTTDQVLQSRKRM